MEFYPDFNSETPTKWVSSKTCASNHAYWFPRSLGVTSWRGRGSTPYHLCLTEKEYQRQLKEYSKG